MLARHDPARMREIAEQAVKWAAEKKISVYVDKVYPLAKAAEALGAIARREVKGKIVLRP
jgi:NADPH:quinone reductase-like Zn-dependent oxidoreductase